jgi:hypothetical protein
MLSGLCSVAQGFIVRCLVPFGAMRIWFAVHPTYMGLVTLALCRSGKPSMMWRGVMALVVLTALVGMAGCTPVDSPAMLHQVEANQRPVGEEGDWHRGWHILQANTFTSCMLNTLTIAGQAWAVPHEPHEVLPRLLPLLCAQWAKPQWQQWALELLNKVFGHGEDGLLMGLNLIQQPLAPDMSYSLWVPVWQRANHPDQWVSRCMVIDPSRLAREVGGHIQGQAGFSLHDAYIQHHLSSLSEEAATVGLWEYLHRLICFVFRGASPLAAAAAGGGGRGGRRRGRPPGPRARNLVSKVGLVGHMCGVPNCVNPYHLCWVSSSANAHMRQWHNAPGHLGKLWPGGVSGVGRWLRPLHGPQPM